MLQPRKINLGTVLVVFFAIWGYAVFGGGADLLAAKTGIDQTSMREMVWLGSVIIGFIIGFLMIKRA